MKFCSPHWEKLKDEVKAQGLWELVPQSGEEAARRMADHANGNIKAYDPLMSAHNMICANAVKAGGVYLLQGDFCPLCELDKNKEAMQESSKDWIEKSVKGCLDYCIENKLVEVH